MDGEPSSCDNQLSLSIRKGGMGTKYTTNLTLLFIYFLLHQIPQFSISLLVVHIKYNRENDSIFPWQYPIDDIVSNSSLQAIVFQHDRNKRTKTIKLLLAWGKKLPEWSV